MKAIIIGCGASGIACAIRLKQNRPDCDVVVLEHLPSPCKKIYATGNGRCNLTNVNADGYQTVYDFFSQLGLMLRSDSAGRVYPYSNQAGSVVDVLLSACEKLKIKIVTECNIHRTEKIGSTFNIYSSKGIFSGEVLVLATGGMAQSTLGSDGSGYEIAKCFNHTVTELSPALVQLKSPSKNCRVLKGVRTKCNVSIEKNASVVASEFGELLFAEYGISGIVVMDLSKHISDKRIKEKADKYTAIIDFVPELSEEELIEHYNKFSTFSGILPQKLCSVIARQAENDGVRMAKYIKNWKLIISGTKGFDFAQITNGGVTASEITNTNESTICDNLYIVGELTDNQFECGGFNLNYAFRSGIVAADDISGKEYDTN